MNITPLNSADDVQPEQPPLQVPSNEPVDSRPSQPLQSFRPQQPLPPPTSSGPSSNIDLGIESVTPRAKVRRKKIIAALVVVLVVFGLGGGGYYYYSTVPLKSDYAAASTSYTSLTETNESLARDAMLASTVLTDAGGLVVTPDLIDEKFKKLDSEMEVLGKSPVMKNESVKVSFNSFKAQYAKYKQMYKDVIVDGLVLMAEYRTHCTALSSSTTQQQLNSAKTVAQLESTVTAIMQPCIDASDKLKAAKSTAIAMHGTNVTPIMITIRDQLKAQANAKSISAVATAKTEADKTVAALKVEVDAFSKNIVAEVESAMITDELKAFEETLAAANSKALL